MKVMSKGKVGPREMFKRSEGQESRGEALVDQDRRIVQVAAIPLASLGSPGH
jgi:hypothetical protein